MRCPKCDYCEMIDQGWGFWVCPWCGYNQSEED